jgi:hypothetical protein
MSVQSVIHINDNILIKLTPDRQSTFHGQIKSKKVELTFHNRVSRLHTSMADIVSDVDICLTESRVYSSVLIPHSSPDRESPENEDDLRRTLISPSEGYSCCF